MEHKAITNEALRKKFNNQFELVSYAISLAENMIQTGREPRVRTEMQNRALWVLAEIAAGKDHLEPVIIEKRHDEHDHNHHSREDQVAKAPERKRTRKILNN